MNRITAFLAGVIVGALGLYLSLTYHFVRAHDGMHVVSKMSAKFSDTYVDIREFNVQDWDQHRPLAVALYQAEKGHLLQDSATESFRNAVDNVLHQLGAKDSDSIQR